MKFPTKKYSPVAIGLAAGLSLGTVNTAQASVLADAILEVTDFLFVDTSNNNATVTTSQISITAGANTGNVDAELVGLSASDSANVDIQTGINLTQVCVGTCPPVAGFVDDYYGTYVALDPLPPGASFAAADADLAGTSVDFGQGTTGADAQTRATSALISDNIGDATSNLGLAVTFTINAMQAFSIGFTLDFNRYLQAFMSTDENLGSNAFASSSWNLMIVNAGGNASAGDIVQGSVSPAGLQGNASALLPNTNDIQSASGSFSSGTIANLVAGGQYRITLRHTTEADTKVVPVPEPTTLALLGAGLLGFGAIRRRKQATAYTSAA